MRPAGGGAPARCWLYARVSGRAQATDGTSLDGQEERGRAYLAGLRYPEPVVRVEVESASEARIERRVVLHRLVREVASGDLVVVAALDRWSRDLVWGLRSIRDLVARGVRFYALREGLDPSTPEGKERLGLLLWVAESERSRIRDRTVGRAEELRGQGLWAYGTVPYGYVRGSRAERHHLLLEAEPGAAAVVLELHQRLAGGTSLREAAAWLGTHPGAPRDAGAVHRIVRGRIYLGELRAGGEWGKGQHPALVPLELWERVQRALKGRRDQPVEARGSIAADLLLAGLVRCGLCGRRLGLSRVTKQQWVWRYYVCPARRRPKDAPRPCAGPYARTEGIDAQVVDAALERLGELRELLAGARLTMGETAKPPADFDALRARIEGRLARAVSLATDGTITTAELVAQRARLDRELDALRTREDAAARERRAADPVARGTLRRALADVRKTWRKMSTGERREALRLLVSRVEILADGSLRWTWRTVEDLLAEE